MNSSYCNMPEHEEEQEAAVVVVVVVVVGDEIGMFHLASHGHDH
jgi:hypothetical protein